MPVTHTTGTWNGFKRLDFRFEDRAAILVLPNSPEAGHRWLLKTEYFDAFPAFELDMLHCGYALAYLQNRTRWYAPDDAHSKARFCAFLTAEYGLCERCLPVGMSCGGMHAVYFAAEHPSRVAALYLDAPVLNLLSCPCGLGLAGNSMYDEFVRDTGKTVSSLLNYRNHPIDRVDTLIEHNIPVFLVGGDSDTIVPFAENGQVLWERYRAAGAPITCVVKPGCDHHPHGLSDRTPLIAFAEQYYGG